MPRILIRDAGGYNHQIDTRNPATLQAWFDEILPHTSVNGRPGIDDFAVIWPVITVYPMFSWESYGMTDPDWFVNSRYLGRIDPFPANDGISGMRELKALYERTQKEVDNEK
jgi:hypothetical protein